MAIIDDLLRIAKPLGDSIRVNEGPEVTVRDEVEIRANIEPVVRTAVFGDPRERGLARWLIRTIAVEIGAYPASIHEYYIARGQGRIKDDFTVPAINLRALTYTAAKAVFRAALACDAGALIFEIARSEMGYTDQRPTEYAATILGAAIAEGYKGPVFIQGDHFQISASRYAKDAAGEVETVCDLSKESVDAGFFNIDIDTSTLVDLEQKTISEQQRTNYTLCAEIAAHVRSIEPEGVTISLGGEIGEVGGQNSTEPELRAFMDGFKNTLPELSKDAVGLSKISIQTGTSHGGVVLPDGSIADVSVDFATLGQLSLVAKDYDMGGAVQHGASTLPDEAFTKFAEAGALEVHLATGFQNILFDHIPESLLGEIYAYLSKNHGDERKEGQTDDQFFYKTRKRALGPFKKALWDLSGESLAEIDRAWEEQFQLLFKRLNIQDTRASVKEYTAPLQIYPDISGYIDETTVEEDVSDLAD